jgi:hypothetical protein
MSLPNLQALQSLEKTLRDEFAERTIYHSRGDKQLTKPGLAQVERERDTWKAKSVKAEEERDAWKAKHDAQLITLQDLENFQRAVEIQVFVPEGRSYKKGNRPR